MDAIELLEPVNPMTHGNAGDLPEEVISMLIKTRNYDKDDYSEICIVCQDNLCQEDKMIGVLDCRHEYHVTCIKQWLHGQNVLLLKPLFDARGVIFVTAIKHLDHLIFLAQIVLIHYAF
ncbi:hypothetical protein BUALT_Bualt03G0215600 [Buddleja alternifolia]|uniref:RING-type E3 ubiquitin transferase n=1 Tax=Buddleja alternifolia TaxID=168488 RepID=A0AAV6Y6Z4_9LAMI|nr:hypothetical protein BUALT_Bualt03G0215600 [Buddleja alternifolia]